MGTYDRDNVFFKILQKEIPADVVYEDDVCLAFRDINPQCRVHVLVITKELRTDFSDFVNNTPTRTVHEFFRSVAKVAVELGVDKTGYRLQTNTGADAGQEVAHFHVHILGGEKL